jgi:hypothetical protein
MDDLFEERQDRELAELRDQHLPLDMQEPRQIWDRSNPLTEYTECSFRLTFRFTKTNFLKIVNIVKEELSFPDQRGGPLTPLQQVALTVSFYACNSFL